MNNVWKRKHVVFGIVVAIAVGVYVRHISVDKRHAVDTLSNRSALTAPQRLSGPSEDGGHSRGSLASLPSVAAVRASPEMARKLGVVITACRNQRVDDAVAGRAIGADPFVIFDSATSCAELFEHFKGSLGEALGGLRQSFVPAERGYYFDAAYDKLANQAVVAKMIQNSDSAERIEFEKRGDDLFEAVMRDADFCDEETLVRAHLTSKFASSKYDNLDGQFFMSYVLVAKDYENAGFVSYMRDRAAMIDPARAEYIKTRVFSATKNCGRGRIFSELKQIVKAY